MTTTPVAPERTPVDPLVEDDPSERRPRLVAFVAAAVAVAAVVATSVVWWQVLDRRADNERAEQARTAAEMIVVDLLSYRYESVEEELDVALGNVTGPFADEYRRLAAEVIVPVSRERQVGTEAVVVKSGVVETTPDAVTVLLFVDQATTAVDAPGTRRDISRIEVTVRDVDGTFKIDRLDAV